jgi:hypothetical protein
MDKLVIDPTRVYEVGGNRELLKAAVVNFAAGNNQQVVAAVTNKRIRVMGWFAQGIAAAVVTYRFKSNSGGTAIIGDLRAPASTAGAIHQIPIVDSGYCETSTGQGLFADCGNDIAMTVFYIEYTP